jgi:hypothetical protein
MDESGMTNRERQIGIGRNEITNRDGTNRVGEGTNRTGMNRAGSIQSMFWMFRKNFDSQKNNLNLLEFKYVYHFII